MGDDAVPEHWDEELERIETHARHIVTHHKATAVIGVAVDDNRKRDYFIPRLQAILRHEWARHLTFRVVPVLGGTSVDLTEGARE
jgi:hypothetical protein